MELDDPVELQINHYHSYHVYAREMKLPATALCIGRIHRFDNLNILSKGDVSVLSIDGSKRLSAPYTYVAKAGSKRLIYAYTDAVWTTVIGTPVRDLSVIQNEFTCVSYDELKEHL